MSERVGIVGSRQGADLDMVDQFAVELHAKHPDSTVVSGGAKGVDQRGEQKWLELGGKVVSFRPKQTGLEEYAIECWELGTPQPRMFLMIDHPTFADYKSACLYRDMLIAESSDRLAAFFSRLRSPGTAFTAGHARECDKPVYEFVSA